MTIEETNCKPPLGDIPSADARYDSYRSERRYWQDASGQAIATLSKSLVTLSTAGIGLTIAMITQDFEPKDTIEFIPLVSAWCGFLCTILLVHLSYKYAQQASRAYIDEEDAMYRNLQSDLELASDERIEFDNKLATALRFSQWTFYFAIISTLGYVTVLIAR